MYEELTELIQKGDIDEALYVFQEEFFHIDEKTPEDAARLCVLEASIWEFLNDPVAEFEAIGRGLRYDPGNYELFYMLGLYYINTNINQAFLCMEMALFYCSCEEDRALIAGQVEELKKNPAMDVKNTSIMILSYNDPDILKDCIDSVEKYVPPGSYEIVVVDNASTDTQVPGLLRSKRDDAPCRFVLVENAENEGFPKGCNTGARNCSPGNDIFFLNNDAVLMQNSLFFMRMGLYEDRNVGAVGPMSNSASLQEVDRSLIDGAKEFDGDIPWHRQAGYRRARKIFEKYASKNSTLMNNPYTRVFRLTGFALLISAQALKAVSLGGQVFDEAFSPGYFEDDDLGIRVARAGFTQLVCRNSFVYHNGGSGFEGAGDAMERGREKFVNKWGFDIWGYSLPWFDAADAVIELSKEKRGHLRIIDFTCGFGATAAYIKSKCPEAFVAGVCRTSFEAGIARHLADEVAFGELNTMRLPWERHSFDVVIAEKKDVCKCRIAECLCEGGIPLTDNLEDTQ
ncbi:MAG: glycosyltransferase family 2 protein [Butyrivibrio sp.]|nr:glycosyltransferase family 2 protein [Butyrivibrio sp.]